MELNIEQNADTITIEIQGRVDTNTSPTLQNEILNAFQKGKIVILDFNEVPYISSAGLRALLIGQKTAASKGAKMELIHVSDMVMNVLTSVGFTKILNIKE